jgi:toxin YoeB
LGNNFTNSGWEEYISWQSVDKKTLKKINKILEDIPRNGYEGIGKPEPLTGDRQGWWSRRIDQKNRIIYKILENGDIVISGCRGHYDD